MITLKQTIVVTHDDPYADYYRKNLTKESSWIVMEDTIAVSYEQTKFYKTILDGDMKITYPMGETEMKEKAVKLVERSCLTPNQRLRLKEKIDEIELITGRRYTALTYQDKNTYLSFVDSMGYYKADTFTDFLSFMDSAFEPGKLYLLSDLLGETE